MLKPGEFVSNAFSIIGMAGQHLDGTNFAAEPKAEVSFYAGGALVVLGINTGGLVSLAGLVGLANSGADHPMGNILQRIETGLGLPNVGSLPPIDSVGLGGAPLSGLGTAPELLLYYKTPGATTYAVAAQWIADTQAANVANGLSPSGIPLDGTAVQRGGYTVIAFKNAATGRVDEVYTHAGEEPIKREFAVTTDGQVATVMPGGKLQILITGEKGQVAVATLSADNKLTGTDLTGAQTESKTWLLDSQTANELRTGGTSLKSLADEISNSFDKFYGNTAAPGSALTVKGQPVSALDVERDGLVYQRNTSGEYERNLGMGQTDLINAAGQRYLQDATGRRVAIQAGQDVVLSDAGVASVLPRAPANLLTPTGPLQVVVGNSDGTVNRYNFESSGQLKSTENLQIFDDGSSLKTVVYPNGNQSITSTATDNSTKQIDPTVDTSGQVVANNFELTNSNGSGVVISAGNLIVNPIDGSSSSVLVPVNPAGVATGPAAMTSSGAGAPVFTGRLSPAAQATLNSDGATFLALKGLFDALAGPSTDLKPVLVAGSVISLANNLSPGSLPLQLTAVASAVGALGSLFAFDAAFSRGDYASAGLAATNGFVAGVSSYAYFQGYTSLAQAAGANAFGGLAGAAQAASEAIPFLNIANDLIHENYGGAIGAAIGYWIGGPIGSAFGELFGSLLFGGSPPQPRGNAHAHWDQAANGGAGAIKISSNGEAGGDATAYGTLSDLITKSGYIVQQFNGQSPAVAIGLIPQRLGSLSYAYGNGVGGYQFTVSTINPATGTDTNPGLRFNTDGKVVSTYTGDQSYFQNLPTYYTTNALSRQAIAPSWEVDTARLQDKDNQSNSGLSEIERAANLGHLAGAKPTVAAGVLEKWNPIALNFGGGLATKSIATSGVRFNVDGNAELDERLQGTSKPQFLHRTEWLNATDGFLVLDKNVNGTLDNAEELFSNSAVGESYRGTASLATWDADGNHVIDAADPIYAAMQIWKDANGNGVQDAGEKTSLAAMGITSLDYANGTYTQGGQPRQMATLGLTAETVGIRYLAAEHGIRIVSNNGTSVLSI